MTINRDLANKAFMSFSLSPGVEFKLNDPVEITGGEYAGVGGSVISIADIDPEISFLDERGDGGGDIIIPQRLLKLID